MFSVLVSMNGDANDVELYGENCDNYNSTVIYNPSSIHSDGSGFISFVTSNITFWHPNSEEISINPDLFYVGSLQCDKGSLTLYNNFEGLSYPLPSYGNNSGGGNAITYKIPYAKNFSSYTPLTNEQMSSTQLEILIKSLFDWGYDGESHEICLSVPSCLYDTERLQNLIQMANEKGWTVYY